MRSKVVVITVMYFMGATIYFSSLNRMLIQKATLSYKPLLSDPS